MATLAVFLVATVSLNLSPGPDMLYVISRSLGQGRKAGIVSALGIGAGNSRSYSYYGDWHLRAIAVLNDRVRDYPICRCRLPDFSRISNGSEQGNRTSNDSLKVSGEASLRSVFWQGAATNVLNPKVALFFLAFLPQFVDKSEGGIAWQIVLLGLIFDTSGTTWNAMVAMIAGRVGDMLKKRAGFSRIQIWLPGCILVALGLLVMLR